jgi:predicted RNA-binding Zn-ribbon protein involved in translation (DUF1610 family)
MRSRATGAILLALRWRLGDNGGRPSNTETPTMPTVQCLGCGREIEFEDDEAGQRFECAGCGAVVVANAPLSQKRESRAGLTCPGCGQTLAIPIDLLEVPVTCSLCQTLFWPMTGVIIDGGPESETEPIEEPDLPYQREDLLPRELSWQTDQPAVAQESLPPAPDDQPHYPLVPSDAPSPAPLVEAGYQDCPYCGEQILAHARKCKHCGEIVDPQLVRERHAVYVRCFDCGQSFHEQDIIRAEVRVGRSFGQSSGSFGGSFGGWHGGLFGGGFGGSTSSSSSANHYGKVDLCSGCFQKRRAGCSGCGCLSAVVLAVTVFAGSAAVVLFGF